MKTEIANEVWEVWVENALEDVFPNSSKPGDASTVLELHTARNEYESGQVVVRANTTLTNVSVAAGPLIGPDGARLERVTVRKLNYVHLGKNTASEEEGLAISPESRRAAAPAIVPAYLSHSDAVIIDSGNTTAFWITVHVPPGTPAGEYGCPIRISSDQANGFCTLRLKVYDVTIPDMNHSSSYNNTIWFISCGVLPGVEMDDGTSLGTETQTEDVYGFANFSDDWWTLLRNMAVEMGKYRHNCIHVPLFYLLAPDMSIDEEGRYTFQWEKFDRFVQIFFEYGSAKRLEGQHLIHKRGSWNKGYSGWLFKRNPDGSAALDWAEPSSSEYRKHLEQLLRALTAHLSDKGWLPAYVQHCADEALTEDQLADAKIVYEMIREYAPAIKSIDACNKACIPVFGDLLDIYVPRLDEYHDTKDEFDALKGEGKELWHYTCCGPQENYLSRLEDYKLASTRLLHWYSFKNGLNGFLHWAYNLWCFGEKKNNPFIEVCTRFGFPGDAWIVYPDVPGKSVLQSPRNEAMRDGIEEYELFAMYERIDKAGAHRLVDRIVKSAAEHDLRADRILDVKVELLQVLSGAPIR